MLFKKKLHVLLIPKNRDKVLYYSNIPTSKITNKSLFNDNDNFMVIIRLKVPLKEKFRKNETEAELRCS
jgi:hypothetical protein